MKKLGKIMWTLAGVGTIVGYCYRGPIMDMAKSLKNELEYFFSINADSVKNGELNSDVNAMANRVLNNSSIIEGIDDPDWDYNSAASEVYDGFLEELPFVKEIGDWINENIINKDVDDGSGEDGTDESVESPENYEEIIEGAKDFIDNIDSYEEVTNQ